MADLEDEFDVVKSFKLIVHKLLLALAFSLSLFGLLLIVILRNGVERSVKVSNERSVEVTSQTSVKVTSEMSVEVTSQTSVKVTSERSVEVTSQTSVKVTSRGGFRGGGGGRPLPSGIRPPADPKGPPFDTF